MHKSTNDRQPRAIQARTKTAAVKLTPEQYRTIEQRAAHCGVRTSVWIRSVLLQAANKPAKEGYLRIKEPDGAVT